jgi:DNA-binding LytR/AlgR family response regulator
MEHTSHVTAASVVLAALAGREPIAERAVLAAVVVLDRAAAVVWAWQPPAALVALAARAARAGMRVVSPMAQMVVVPARVAVVAWGEPLARRARTPRCCLAELAVSAVMLELLVVALQVSAA